MIVKLRIGAALAIAALAAGCSSITQHRGYIVDEALVSAIQPGLDNKLSVEGTLGRPTFTSLYGDETWYYISSVTDQKPFSKPKISEHSVLAVHFDKAGNVVEADRTGMEQVVRITPDSDKTPTLGRERGFLEDLFGNIGQVGSMGAGAGAPGTGP